MNIIITGEKGVGKTTVVQKVAEKFGAIGGFICPDQDIINLSTGEKHQFLYKESQGKEEVIGPWHIPKSVISFGEEAVKNALGQGLWSVIDEFGLLEMRKKGFYTITKESVPSHRLIIIVRNINIDHFLDEFGADFEVFRVTEDNRDSIYEKIFIYLRSLEEK